eukprot:5353246-Amphidinium_carterae.1
MCGENKCDWHRKQLVCVTRALGFVHVISLTCKQMSCRHDVGIGNNEVNTILVACRQKPRGVRHNNICYVEYDESREVHVDNGNCSSKAERRHCGQK